MKSAVTAFQDEFAAALLDPALACPQGLRTWNGSDPAVRLAVHRNNVVASLIDALADTFPVVQELVGTEFFRAMAAVFVRQSPPRSRILAHYGQQFPDFVERFEPAGSVPYLADMARLEMARVRAYHAGDAEPSVSVVRSRHAVVSLWAAHQDGSDLGLIDVEQPEEAVVLRVGLDVLVLRLPPTSDFPMRHGS